MSTLSVNNVTEVGGAPVVTAGVLDSGSLPAGSIVAVSSVAKTTTFSASLASKGSTDITDLSITHSIASSGNKVLLIAQIGNSGNDIDSSAPGFAFAEDGTLLNLGDTAGNRSLASVGVQNGISNGPGHVGFSHALTFLHAPTTGSKTYTVRVINTTAGTRTCYVNTTGSGEAVNDANRIRTACTFTLMEVAG